MGISLNADRRWTVTSHRHIDVGRIVKRTRHVWRLTMRDVIASSAARPFQFQNSLASSLLAYGQRICDQRHRRKRGVAVIIRSAKPCHYAGRYSSYWVRVSFSGLTPSASLHFARISLFSEGLQGNCRPAMRGRLGESELYLDLRCSRDTTRGRGRHQPRTRLIPRSPPRPQIPRHRKHPSAKPCECSAAKPSKQSPRHSSNYAKECSLKIATAIRCESLQSLQHHRRRH